MGKTILSRREREKAKHKKEILSAALKLFSDKGFHNVSMQDIANRSEFGVGTLYKFFESKEDLFEELIDNTGQQVLNEFMGILDGPGSEAERLTIFFRSIAQFRQQHEEVIKLYVSAFGVQGSRISKFRDRSKIHEKLNSSVAKLIKEGIDKGLFRAVDPEITSKAINSTIETIIFDIAESTEQPQVVERFKKVEQLFLEGLLKPE